MDYDAFDMPEPVKLMVAGDWHSNSRWAVKTLKHARLQGCDAVLHLGDFGFWPRHDQLLTQGFYKGVMDYCRQSHLRLYWLDGNHEHHELLNPGMGNDVIRHLPRGHRWQWWNKTWMAVGGGVSVDKKYRRPQIDWFPEETLTPRQFEHCMRDGAVDIIVSHDCPDGIRIPGVHAADKQDLVDGGGFPAEAIADGEDHRKLIGDITRQVGAKLLIHGHYHVRYETTHGNLGVIGLDRDKSTIADNTLILTKDSVFW